MQETELDRVRSILQLYVNGGLKFYATNIKCNINWYKNDFFLLKYYIFDKFTSLFLCATINSLYKLNCHHKNNEQNHYQSLCTN
jgi:hypothetical protein